MNLVVNLTENIIVGEYSYKLENFHVKFEYFGNEISELERKNSFEFELDPSISTVLKFTFSKKSEKSVIVKFDIGLVFNKFLETEILRDFVYGPFIGCGLNHHEKCNFPLSVTKIKFSLKFLNFGVPIENIFPLHVLFSEEYQYDPLVLLICKFLPPPFVVHKLCMVSKHIHDIVSRNHVFESIDIGHSYENKLLFFLESSWKVNDLTVGFFSTINENSLIPKLHKKKVQKLHISSLCFFDGSVIEGIKNFRNDLQVLEISSENFQSLFIYSRYIKEFRSLQCLRFQQLKSMQFILNNQPVPISDSTKMCFWEGDSSFNKILSEVNFNNLKFFEVPCPVPGHFVFENFKEIFIHKKKVPKRVSLSYDKNWEYMSFQIPKVVIRCLAEPVIINKFIVYHGFPLVISYTCSRFYEGSKWMEFKITFYSINNCGVNLLLKMDFLIFDEIQKSFRYEVGGDKFAGINMQTSYEIFAPPYKTWETELSAADGFEEERNTDSTSLNTFYVYLEDDELDENNHDNILENKLSGLKRRNSEKMEFKIKIISYLVYNSKNSFMKDSNLVKKHRIQELEEKEIFEEKMNEKIEKIKKSEDGFAQFINKNSVAVVELVINNLQDEYETTVVLFDEKLTFDIEYNILNGNSNETRRGVYVIRRFGGNNYLPVSCVFDIMFFGKDDSEVFKYSLVSSTQYFDDLGGWGFYDISLPREFLRKNVRECKVIISVTIEIGDHIITKEEFKLMHIQYVDNFLAGSISRNEEKEFLFHVLDNHASCQIGIIDDEWNYEKDSEENIKHSKSRTIKLCGFDFSVEFSPRGGKHEKLRNRCSLQFRNVNHFHEKLKLNGGMIVMVYDELNEKVIREDSSRYVSNEGVFTFGDLCSTNLKRRIWKFRVILELDDVQFDESESGEEEEGEGEVEEEEEEKEEEEEGEGEDSRIYGQFTLDE